MIFAEDLVGPWYKPPFEIATVRDIIPIYSLGGGIVDYVARKAKREIEEEEDKKLIQLLNAPTYHPPGMLMHPSTWNDICQWQQETNHETRNRKGPEGPQSYR